MKKYYIAMAILAAVSIVAVVWEYTINRGAAGDRQKVQDILSLQSQVDNFISDQNEVPTSLSALSVSGDLAKRLSNYEYSNTSDTYTICANFSTDISVEGSTYNSTTSSPYYHKQGRQCFTESAYISSSNSSSDSNSDYLNDYYNNYYNNYYTQ